MSPVVIGLDLSLTSTGIAIIDGGSVTLHRVKSKGAKGDTLAARHVRLLRITDETYSLGIYNSTDRCSLVVIESPAFSRTTGHMHDRSGLWWLTVDIFRMHGYPVAEVTPTARAKYATGKGNAGKDAVLAAVVRRYPDVEVSGNDEADALVLAAMG
ncbi:MAG: hypothetical protein H0X35_14780, partial [Pseudonocardiales bacterium]|nr:hypothetical protein [Pseudonocardiales bacterium]